PSYKSGEGSLRLCQQINPKANTNNRAVSDLKVSYLVFPGSGEKPWRAPDLGRWRDRCAGLLTEMGGHRGELYVWENLIKPPPPPPAPVQSPASASPVQPPIPGPPETAVPSQNPKPQATPQPVPQRPTTEPAPGTPNPAPVPVPVPAAPAL
ncbi:MAG: hypothetical protein RLZZ253_3014, partial [Verrucomicrobiota bacterium]